MGWTSILPEELTHYEVWAVRIFLILALVTMGPASALVIYDFLLYCFRVIVFEFPFVGGRARGQQRPRAPSLSERADGSARRMSLQGGSSPDAGPEGGLRRPLTGSGGNANSTGHGHGYGHDRSGSGTGGAKRRQVLAEAKEE